MTKRTISQDLGRFVSDLSLDQLSVEQREIAKSRILDSLALSFASREMRVVGQAWNSVDHSPGQFSVIGRWPIASDRAAAFANGISANGVSQQDSIIGQSGHPSATIVPAALAAAESVHASGETLLLGVASGYEICGRVGDGVTREFGRRGWQGVPMSGVIGAGAAAAKVFRLPEAEIGTTLSIAANFTGGLYQGHADGTDERTIQAGFAAQNGLMAARLARAGAVASPNAFEGSKGFYQTFSGSLENVPRVLDDLGECSILPRVFSKPYVACLLNQQIMDLARTISTNRPSGGFASVRAIMDATDLRTPGLLRRPPFGSSVEAFMSVAFCVSATLLGRPVDSAHYRIDSYGDPEVADLAERVEVVGVEGHMPRLEVSFNDGTALTLEEDRSHIGRPDLGKSEARYLRYAESAVGKKARRAVELVEQLEDLADLRPFSACLRGAEFVVHRGD